MDDTNVVALGEPLISTPDAATKLVPLTVSVKLFPPAVVEAGLIEIVVGTGFKTANAVDVAEPPPGTELANPIVEVPAAAVSVVVSDIVSWVDDATVVALLVPLKVAVVLTLKPVPVMVKVGDVLTNVEVGEIVAIIGAGFLATKVWALDVPPPRVGVKTVTEEVAPTAISAALMVAVSCVDDAKTVVLPDPFHSAVEFETKFVPMRVTVKLFPPAAVEVGEIEVSVGAKLLTVTVLLKVDVTPVDVAQILIASPKLYFIAVEVITPAVTAEPLAGVEVSVPLPAVPPQTCVESTGAKPIVAVLFDISVFPYWSSR